MRLILLSVLLTMASAAPAQCYETKVQGCVGDERVELRWAPANHDTWRAGIRKGYVVERITIMRQGEILPPADMARERKMLGAAFTPAPLEEWEPFADDKYAAIAAECVYGEESAESAVSPKAVYMAHLRNMQLFSFALYAADMSPNVAWLSGLSCADNTVRPDEKYLYKVYVNDTVPQDTAMVFIDAASPTPLRRIPKPTVKWGCRTAEVSVSLRALGGAYTSYVIERSADGGENFTRLAGAPIVSIEPEEAKGGTLFKRDSLPDNNTMFVYRVYGIDCFGRQSEPSVSEAGHGVVPLAATPRVTRCEVVGNNRVEVEWEFPDTLAGAAAGFRVYRRKGPKSPLKKIYDGSDPLRRKFVDLMPGITNYYKVSAYNAERENITPVVSYAALVDSLPPSPPVAVEGDIDSTGVATIRWMANHESDLAGYRVYTANTKDDGEYSLITPTTLTDTLFRHKVSLNTLTREVFYHVRAVDWRDNHSLPSQPLMLTRPDTISPVAPVMKSALEKDGLPHLQWACSTSDDVARHLLLRREPKAERFDTVAIFADLRCDYRDKSAADGQDYVYAIVAEDRSGNSSRLSSSFFHTSKTVGDKVEIKCRKDGDGNRVTWSVETRRDVKGYIVLRSVGGGDLRIVSETTESGYYDADVTMGASYTYAIKIIFSDGEESGVYK